MIMLEASFFLLPACLVQKLFPGVPDLPWQVSNMLNRVYRISRQASRAYASNSRKSSAQLCQDKVQPTQASRRSLQTSSCASSITSNTTTKTSKRSKSTASGSWFNDQFRGEVTLVSYNVLSQSHLQKHRNLYQGVDEKYLDWEHRQELLAKFFTNQVKNNHANVFCLQEVDRRHVDTFYRPLFKKLGFSFRTAVTSDSF